MPCVTFVTFAGERHELTVRNREAPLAVFVAPSAARLAERLAPAGATVGAKTRRSLA